MSSELFRKYIDLVEGKEQLDEGLAKALGVLGLLSIAGIAGQHMAATPNYDQVVKSPQFTQQLKHNLAANKEYAAADDYFKGADVLAHPEKYSDDDRRFYTPIQNATANMARGAEFNDTYRQTVDQALDTVKAQQPTIWNKIKDTVSDMKKRL